MAEKKPKSDTPLTDSMVFVVDETYDPFKYRDSLIEIGAGLGKAMEHHAQILVAMRELERSGMYPSVPTFSWETRNGGDTKYLRLRWKSDSEDDGFLGPDGKEKTYIGCCRAKIAEAERKARNRELWENLYEIQGNLRRWLGHEAVNVRRQAVRVENYTRANLDQFKPSGGEE